VAAPSGVAHGDGDAVNEDAVMKFGVVPGDGHAGVQDVVTKLAGDAAHGDRNAGCQDGVTKVACGAAHGDGGRRLPGRRGEGDMRRCPWRWGRRLPG
jgi:hypothetical protein